MKIYKILINSFLLLSFSAITSCGPKEVKHETEEPVHTDKSDTTNIIKTEVDNTAVDSIGDKF